MGFRRIPVLGKRAGFLRGSCNLKFRGFILLFLFFSFSCFAQEAAVSEVWARGNIEPDPRLVEIGALIASVESALKIAEKYNDMQYLMRRSGEEVGKAAETYLYSIRWVEVLEPNEEGTLQLLRQYSRRLSNYSENIGRLIAANDMAAENTRYNMSGLGDGTVINEDRYAILQMFKFMRLYPITGLDSQKRQGFSRKYGLLFGRFVGYNEVAEILSKKVIEAEHYAAVLKTQVLKDREMFSFLADLDRELTEEMTKQYERNYLFEQMLDSLNPVFAEFRSIVKIIEKKE